MKKRHHVAIQMEEEQQWQKDNGPIVKTADQLWHNSGKVEENNPYMYTHTIGHTRRGDAIKYYIDNLKKRNNGTNNNRDD